MRPTRSQRKETSAERQAGGDGTACIGQCFASRLAFISGSRPGEADRLETDHGKDTGHDVEDQPAKDCAAQRKEQRNKAGIAAALRDRSGGRRNFEPFTIANRNHAFQCFRTDKAISGLARFDHQRVAVTADLLWGGVVQGIFAGRIEPGIARRAAGRKGDSDPDHRAVNLELCLTAKRPRQFHAPRIEPGAVDWRHETVANDKIQRQFVMFWYADLVCARQAVNRQPDRECRPLCQSGRDVELYQQRMLGVEDMVHQISNDEAFGHRIARCADRRVLGQAPVQPRGQTRIARILPIAMPAGFGLHADCQCNHASGCRRAGFGNE